MKFKLIMALTSDEKTGAVCKAARKLGATGSTVINSARGEGLNPAKTFLGLTLEGQVDVAIFLVEEHLARLILEGISEAGGFDKNTGTGIAFQMDIEDAVGLKSQIGAIGEEIEDQL
jgi:Nitrogen regulatory protein P-II